MSIFFSLSNSGYKIFIFILALIDNLRYCDKMNMG